MNSVPAARDALTLRVIVAALLLCSPLATAADYSLGALAEAPPKAAAAALRKVVGKTGVRVTDSKKRTLADIWFRRELAPPKAAAAADGADFAKQIPAGTFLGLIRLRRKHYDIRDREVRAGLYTIRYGVQPLDGDHLGASETRDFVILCRAKKDTVVDPIPQKKLADLSTEVSGTSHPAILYVISTKNRKKAPALPALYHEEEWNWHVIDFEIAVAGTVDTTADQTVDGKKGKSLRLGLVVVGTIEEF